MHNEVYAGNKNVDDVVRKVNIYIIIHYCVTLC